MGEMTGHEMEVEEDGCFLNCSGPFEAAFSTFKLHFDPSLIGSVLGNFISKVPGEEVTEIHRNITIKYPFPLKYFINHHMWLI